MELSLIVQTPVALQMPMSIADPKPITEITEPAPPLAPLPQTFKCEKCGAAFTDESVAAAHIQTCKGTDIVPDDATPAN